MRSFNSGTRVKMKMVAPCATEIFSGRAKMISPKLVHSSVLWSVVKPSSRRRSIRRVTGSVPSGDSIGFSAFSSCIFFDQTNQIGEFKRFAHVVVGAALTCFLSEIAVAGENDVRDLARLVLRFERRAKLIARHALDRQVREDHRWLRLPCTSQRRMSVRHDLTLPAVPLQNERDEPCNLRIVFHDQNHEHLTLIKSDANAFSRM